MKVVNVYVNCTFLETKGLHKFHDLSLSLSLIRLLVCKRLKENVHEISFKCWYSLPVVVDTSTANILLLNISLLRDQVKTKKKSVIILSAFVIYSVFIAECIKSFVFFHFSPVSYLHFNSYTFRCKTRFLSLVLGLQLLNLHLRESRPLSPKDLSCVASYFRLTFSNTCLVCVLNRSELFATLLDFASAIFISCAVGGQWDDPRLGQLCCLRFVYLSF